jgi:transcription elongation factor GreA
MSNKQNILTKEGYEKLQKDLHRLQTTVRKEIANKLNEAKQFGDLSENAAYSAAMEQRDLNESKIGELEDLLENAKIVEEKHSKSSGVSVGAEVELESDTGEKFLFEIVGAGETDVANKKFDINSPLVDSLLGKKVGQKVEIKLGPGVKTYTIKQVKY